MAIVSMMLSVNGPGTVPLGAIIPVGNAGAWALPASGEIKDGFALCDGTAFPAGSHPSFAGNRPNLTDDRFLNGASSVGGTGGATSKTTTGVAASFDKNVMNTNQNAHGHILPFHYDGSWNPYLVFALNGAGRPLFGSSSYTTNQYDKYIVTNNMGATTRPDLANSDTSTISWNSTTVSTTVTQGTISDIRPKYFGVVYLMRVI